jgi:DNA-binding HxlR family transcriptional regulator
LAEKKKLVEFMHNMSKKGFYDIFEYLMKHESMYYNEILKYAQDNKIVDSRASITTMLNWMVSFGLLERHEITDVRPMRTKYNVSKKGQSALNKIKSFDL